MSHYRFILILAVLIAVLWAELGWTHKGSHGPLRGAKCGIQDAAIKADALAAIEGAQQSASGADEPRRALVLTEADKALVETAHEQAKAGDIEGALATTRALKWSDRGPVLEDIANTLAGDAKFDGAFALVKGMQIQDARVRALISIAHSQAGVGDAEAARKTLDQAADVASTLGTAYGRIEALVMIAKAMADLGNQQGARRLLSYARAEIEKINDPYDLDMLLSEIAKGRAAIGDKEAARNIVQGDHPLAECR